MEKAEVRKAYMLAGFLLLAFATPFAVGVWTDSIFYDRQWLAGLTTVILSGFLQGGVYAMYAVGLTLILGVMRVINVAHGELVMLGAYLTYTLFNTPGFLGLDLYIDPLLTMVITLPIAFLLGVAIQKLLLNAVVGGPELTPLLITFGLGISMINIVELVFTTDYHTIPYQPDAFQITENIFVAKNRLISFSMAFAISMSVYLFLKYNRLGKAIRATAQNSDVAMVCGINIYRVYMITFGLGAALAAAGGTLVSIQFGFNPETGIQYTVVAFAIIILGGRGSFIGALVGAVMLAVLENLVSFLVPNGTAMVEIAAYGMMIFVLLIRPQGLLGAKED
ncbi:MAG: branched-chain amino acid ABC transporter permease [bacterium]